MILQTLRAKTFLIASLMAGFFASQPLSFADCTPPPSGIVSWWPANGNTTDFFGTNNGTIQGNVTYSPGEVSEAFTFDGISSAVICPASGSLNVGTNGGLSIECWIDPVSTNAQEPLANWTSSSTVFGTHFWISVFSPGSLYANIVDTSGTYHAISSAGGIIQPNQFQHVAVTYDKTSGNAVLYYNGAAVMTQYLGSFTPRTTNNFFIGGLPTGGSAYFAGSIDEMAIYNRALSASDISAIYNAGNYGKCEALQNVAIALYAGVQFYGTTGKTYGIQSTTNLSNPNDWIGRTNLVISGQPALWYDPQPANLAQTYYRVLPIAVTIP